MTFKVLTPGPLTTVQDGGRAGQSHLGLTTAGPMDERSCAIANRLVGNERTTAALEITLGGFSFLCQQKVTIALTGAHCPLEINGQAKALWQTHNLAPGDEVKVGYAALGVRSYLAVAGGFDTTQWYGSRSVVIREGLGQTVKQNDILPIKDPVLVSPKRLDFRDQVSLRKRAVLEFVPGYQWDTLSEASQQIFLNSSFLVTPRNNRMGCQFDGPAVETGIRKIYSEGIATGSIQVTGEGKPIVLMRDAQTIGGYPKVGAITVASQSVLAQLPQGSKVRFEAITTEQSIQKYRHFYQEMENVSVLSS